MFVQLTEIVQFMVDAFVKIWPFLLITIPLAVAVNMSGASRYIHRALSTRPLIAIVLATLVGAFSPFCSCGVIPVVASLLIGGVPLAPVMAFWIASPSMDPEIFFLSVSMLGWQLAIWRLASTLVLSLSAGYITFYVMRRGWLGASILRGRYSAHPKGSWPRVKQGWQRLSGRVRTATSCASDCGLTLASVGAGGETSCACSGSTAPGAVGANPPQSHTFMSTATTPNLALADVTVSTAGPSSALQLSGYANGNSNVEAVAESRLNAPSLRRRLLQETWSATVMVAKFMALAFFLEALITLYVPQTWIMGLLGTDQPFVIVMAAILGVPIYTSNLTALPLMGGLLAQGMDPAAALAFLIAGPTTTLPAMAAVWGLTTRRVFALYVAFVLMGAIAAGYAFSLVAALGG